MSAPYSDTASPGNTTCPFEEDIFFPSNNPIPMTTIPCGQAGSSNSSAWWYWKKVRWFSIRSLPENR